LSNLQAWQTCNEKKIIDEMKKKGETKWAWLQIETQCFEEV
jgi:hypothetical protein